MGTHGPTLYADDVACDVRDQFTELLTLGSTPEGATSTLMRDWAHALADEDDATVFWLALADTQWTYGCLDPSVRDRAIRAIDSGLDLNRREGKSRAQRGRFLEQLRARLLSQPPAPRKPRRKKRVEVRSLKELSPNGQAVATAYELSASPIPDAPRMQVIVEMLASGSRGGGGVFAAACDYDDVSLDWRDAETLRITYPAAAAVAEQRESSFYFGRTIKVVYVVEGT